MTASCTRWVAAVLVSATLAACGSPGTERDAVDPDVYAMRGIVRQLPVADQPASELLIHHEPVPEFRDPGGQVIGMDAMAMPFPVADREALEGLAVGDRVAFDLAVAWHGSPPMEIRDLRLLPPETRLSFETASDEEAADESDSGESSHEQHEQQ